MMNTHNYYVIEDNRSGSFAPLPVEDAVHFDNPKELYDVMMSWDRRFSADLPDDFRHSMKLGIDNCENFPPALRDLFYAINPTTYEELAEFHLKLFVTYHGCPSTVPFECAKARLALLRGKKSMTDISELMNEMHMRCGDSVADVAMEWVRGLWCPNMDGIIFSHINFEWLGGDLLNTRRFEEIEFDGDTYTCTNADSF